MKLHVGNHTFRLVHMPGHTAYQAAVIVEEEGVVFTSDNIFCKVHTWLQEADPEPVAGGAGIPARPARGHVRPGARTDVRQAYLDEQGTFIREWVDYVRRARGRGRRRSNVWPTSPP